MSERKVRLIKPLEHARKPHAVDEVVTLPAETAQWVVDQGVGVYVGEPVIKSRKTKEKQHDH